MTAGEAGFLLLCSRLGDPERRPMTPAQRRKLADRVRQMERPVDERSLEPADLVQLGYSLDDAERIVGLLSQRALLERYVRSAEGYGCTPITRVSAGYPLQLRKRLGDDAPGCLWAKGDLSLLSRPGIALVGSRELKPENREFARLVGRSAAQQGFVLISGNARGADREAQDACLEAGGCVISVVADSLTDKAPQERLLYLSEEEFDRTFSIERALSRNRVIHALAWRALVAQTDNGHGGTWDGTMRNLRHGWSPVFCNPDGSEGMLRLMQMGAGRIEPGMLEDFSSLFEIQQSLFEQ